MSDTLQRPYWALRLTYGLVPIIAGLDKFTNLLTQWDQYLSPLATSIVPLAPSTLMGAVGIIEIAAGALVLSKVSRIASNVVAAWLVCIALNLLMMGQFLDVAVRDLVMAVGAFTLARLTEARENKKERAGASAAHIAASRAHA